MRKKLQNYAFIDSQNLNLGIQELGWKLDFKRFRIYLMEKYGVKYAYLFLGYMPENQKMYQALRSYGYKLIFKPVVRTHQKNVKGNIDAELVLHVMLEYEKYEKAVIVTGDGDFYCLVKYLYEQGKFLKLLIPNRYKYSVLLKRAFLQGKSGKHIAFLNDLRKRLEYKKSTPNKKARGA